jgi:hypothetical protein
VRVYERWDRVRQMDSPQGYLFRTALNLHRSRLRWLATRRGTSSTPHPPRTPPRWCRAGTTSQLLVSTFRQLLRFQKVIQHAPRPDPHSVWPPSLHGAGAGNGVFLRPGRGRPPTEQAVDLAFWWALEDLNL